MSSVHASGPVRSCTDLGATDVDAGRLSMSERELAMFPLGTVVFPYASLSLHVFEPRYRTMVRDLLAGDGEFGVVLIERGSEVGGGDTRSHVGTITRLVHASESPDGRFALTTVGVARCDIVSWLGDDPYPRALVRERPDPDLAPRDREHAGRLVETITARLHDVWALYARLDRRVVAPVDLGIAVAEVAAVGAVAAALSTASYLLGARAPIGPFDAQRLLVAPDALSRLAALGEIVDDQALVLRARLDERER